MFPAGENLGSITPPGQQVDTLLSERNSPDFINYRQPVPQAAGMGQLQNHDMGATNAKVQVRAALNLEYHVGGLILNCNSKTLAT